MLKCCCMFLCARKRCYEPNRMGKPGQAATALAHHPVYQACMYCAGGWNFQSSQFAQAVIRTTQTPLTGNQSCQAISPTLGTAASRCSCRAVQLLPCPVGAFEGKTIVPSLTISRQFSNVQMGSENKGSEVSDTFNKRLKSPVLECCYIQCWLFFILINGPKPWRAGSAVVNLRFSTCRENLWPLLSSENKHFCQFHEWRFLKLLGL